jgi:hypothetical protein
MVEPTDFLADPEGTMRTALEVYIDGNSTARLKRLWEGQRLIAPDLLWHLPNSRVAHNIVLEAFSIVETL